MPNFKMEEVINFAQENSQILDEPIKRRSIIEGPINHIKENIRL